MRTSFSFTLSVQLSLKGATEGWVGVDVVGGEDGLGMEGAVVGVNSQRVDPLD